MAGPAYTPITSNPFVDVSSTAEATFNSPTARSYGLGLVQRFREEHLSSLRPMSEFFDRNRVSFPSGFSGAMARANYNVSYFQGNYLLILIVIAAYSLLTNLTLLLGALFLAGGYFLISRLPSEGISIGSKTLSISQLQFILSLIAIIIFFVSSTIGTILWIIGVSAVIIFTHGALMQEDVEGEYVDAV